MNSPQAFTWAQLMERLKHYEQLSAQRTSGGHKHKGTVMERDCYVACTWY